MFKVWCQIEILTQFGTNLLQVNMHIYLKDIRAKFYPDSIWDLRTLGFSEDGHPSNNNNNNNVTMWVGPVPVMPEVILKHFQNKSEFSGFQLFLFQFYSTLCVHLRYFMSSSWIPLVSCWTMYAAFYLTVARVGLPLIGTYFHCNLSVIVSLYLAAAWWTWKSRRVKRFVWWMTGLLRSVT